MSLGQFLCLWKRNIQIFLPHELWLGRNASGCWEFEPIFNSWENYDKLRVKYTVGAAVLRAELYARPLPTLTVILQGRMHALNPQFTGQENREAQGKWVFPGWTARPELKATNKWPDHSNSLVIEELGIIL